MKRLHAWFIASKKNRFHPKLLEPFGLVLVALIVAAMPLIYNLTTAGKMQVLGYATDISAGGLDAATNTQRTNNGLAPLRLNSQLNQAATAKANHMFAKNYWAHTAPDGTTPWSFIQSADYSYSTAGENLAKNFLTSSGVVNGWMNSSAHRANILNSGFLDVGYGIVNGILQGQEVTLVVALYGTPPAPTVAASQPPAQAAQAVAPASTPQPQAAPVETPPQTEPVATATPVVAEPTITPATSSEEATLASNDYAPGPNVITVPIEAYTGLNWAQRASLFIIAALGLLYVMKHTVVWRAQRRGIRQVWLRSHPLSQATVLGVTVIVTLASGTGVVL